MTADNQCSPQGPGHLTGDNGTGRDGKGFALEFYKTLNAIINRIADEQGMLRLIRV